MPNIIQSRTQSIKLAVRETMEDYLNCLDNQNWTGVARCFTNDAVSHYNKDPQSMHGGCDVADWLHQVLQVYSGTNHALSNFHVDLEGELARCDSHVMATLHWGENGQGRVSVRAIRYRDEMVEVEGIWLIRRRIHEPRWQYDALSASPRLQ
ncbi:nuclear transport factor 2 family protein [Pleurocapsa sp. FMAR1]|uniref:nuclear transport factor 2 family protein n=1 Tax=Pleurocapsa sp. FMAR1 TaxID=3040204 RepID=UPI0029C93B43|nr:nuclear transport factor 2 family protein [Pleurocapsa sp. FMAR1]